jgi:IPT/TIG domain
MIKSIRLCAALALVLGIVGAQSASARGGGAARAGRVHARAVHSGVKGTVLVLKAGGQIIPNGAIVHVVASSYLFKGHVTIEGTSSKGKQEEEVECETEYTEQGKIQRNLASNTWSIVEPAGVDFCEGETWFGGHAMTHPLTFSAPNIVTDNSSVELFRTEEQIKEEEQSELAHEEPIHAREPHRCVYTTLLGRGRFKSKKGAPLTAKINGKMVLSTAQSGPGCASTARWKGKFTATYKNLPISSAMEVAPTVTSVTPVESSESGGVSVMIAGTGFTGATAVQFGSANATSFTVNSDSSITAVAPSGSGTVDVTVTTPVTRTATTPADRFTYATRPSVTAISPKAGPEAGGTEVTITGTNFSPGSTVHFGSTPASSVKVNSAESITAVSPKATGTLNVTVTNTGGTSMVTAADKFSFVPAPAVTELSPKQGPEAGGTVVTITGSKFREVSAVKFGSVEAKFKANSETSIEAEAPAGSGTVNVTVTAAGGTSAISSADEFTYLPAPVITEISPKTGPEAGGTTVTITGSNFHEVTAVKFGSAEAKFKVNSESSIEAESPPGVGTVAITVTAAGGTSATVPADEFTY